MYTKKIIFKIIHFFIDIFKVVPITLSAFLTDFKYKKNAYKKLFNEEVVNSGIVAIPMIIVLGFISGILVIVLFPFDNLSFSIRNIYGTLFSNVIIRELAPSLTTFVVMIRSTLAITIELSQMRKYGEIETLEILGINPIQYLGTMKIFAGMLSLPILTIYFAVSALFSSMMSAYFVNNISMIKYLSEIYNTISFSDIIILIIKTTISGIVIFVIAIYNGLTAKKHKNIIINETISAIMVSIFLVLVINISITVIVYAAG